MQKLHDGGKSWSEPVVIAKYTEEMDDLDLIGGRKDVFYPYVFEAKPGKL